MKYDLHNHTWYSPCSLLNPQALLRIVKKKGFDGIAVTDHDTLKGALFTRKLNKDRDFEVIVGEELHTDRGHVLGLFLQKPIKSRIYEGAVEEIHKQGGIVIVAHPRRPMPGAWFKNAGLGRKLMPDGLEAFNGRTSMWSNIHADSLAEELGIAKTAGSDAHFGYEAGSCYVHFDGDLRKALIRKKTDAHGRGKGMLIGGPLSFLSKLTLKMGVRKPYG